MSPTSLEVDGIAYFLMDKALLSDHAERLHVRPAYRADKTGMARMTIALLFFLIACADAQAQNDNWENLSKTPERLIGILDLPDIVAFGCGPAPKRATTAAFATPSENGRRVGTVYWHEVPDVACQLTIEKIGGVKEGIPTLESGYEIPAAIVFERRGQWFRIRLKDGSAWIRRSDATDFLAYPEVLRDNLASTMQNWDGTLRATPGSAGRVIPLSAGWKALLDRTLSIEYLGSRTVGKDLWLHIRLTAKSACDQQHEGVTDIEGWIPAYHTDRTPMSWFASRGC
jgi:hypothetical protein